MRTHYNYKLREMPTLRMHAVKTAFSQAFERLSATGAIPRVIRSQLGDTGAQPDHGPYKPTLMWNAAIIIAYLEENGIDIGVGNQELAHMIGHVKSKNMHRDAFGYPEATGLPLLVKQLSEWWYYDRSTRVLPNRLLIGGGVSGVLRTHFDTYDQGGNIIIDDDTYILVVAEARRRGMDCRVVASRNGIWDTRQLRDLMDDETRAVFRARVGNPVGRLIPENEVIEVLAAISRRSRQLGSLIDYIDDDTYGIYRPGGPLRNAMEIVNALGDALNVHVLTVDGFSKMFGRTGGRIGWLAHTWSPGMDDDVVSGYDDLLPHVAQRELGEVPTDLQMSLALTIMQIRGQIPGLPSLARSFGGFLDHRISLVQQRCAELVAILDGPTDFVLYKEYGVGSTPIIATPGQVIEPITTSPYLVIEHPDPRGIFTAEKPLGFRLIKFAESHGLSLPNTVPLSEFRTTSEGKELANRQTRIVLLITKDEMNQLCDVLRQFSAAYSTI